MKPAVGYILTLSEADCAKADRHARAQHRRWRNAPDQRWTGGYFQQKLEMHVLGSRGELAVALALGLGWLWPPTSSRYDVGIFQVRTTPTDGHGTLLLQPWRKGFHPGDPFILVIAESDVRMRVAGWCYGYEHSQLGTERDFGFGPVWSIVQTALRPMGTLPGYERELAS